MTAARDVQLLSMEGHRAARLKKRLGSPKNSYKSIDTLIILMARYDHLPAFGGKLGVH